MWVIAATSHVAVRIVLATDKRPRPIRGLDAVAAAAAIIAMQANYSNHSGHRHDSHRR